MPYRKMSSNGIRRLALNKNLEEKETWAEQDKYGKIKNTSKSQNETDLTHNQ